MSSLRIEQISGYSGSIDRTKRTRHISMERIKQIEEQEKEKERENKRKREKQFCQIAECLNEKSAVFDEDGNEVFYEIQGKYIDKNR